MTAMRGVYAFVCDRCDHLATEHRLLPDADGVGGPYRCRQCGCEIQQIDPVHGITRAQYDTLQSSR